MAHPEGENGEELGVQMSFLDHLDELRRRLVYSVIIIVIAFAICFYFSERIFQFLSVPVIEALTESQRRELPIDGITGGEAVLTLNTLKEGDRGRYVFNRPTKIGSGVVQPGTSVASIVNKDSNGVLGLYSDEAIYTDNEVISKGIRLPADLSSAVTGESLKEQLTVTTAQEAFTLYVTVSLYSAIALSIPLLLLQVWGFISPARFRYHRPVQWPRNARFADGSSVARCPHRDTRSVVRRQRECSI